MIDTDPFHVLGLRPGASPEEVRGAYRKLAMRWHPDRNPHTRGAEERFKQIKAAYEIASDEAAYRQWCAEQPPPAPPSTAGQTTHEQTLTLTLEEIAHGSRRTIEVERRTPCAPCAGTGRITQTHSQPCRQCQGIGRLRARAHGGANQKCPACDGQGYVRHSECQACEGVGLTIGEAIFEVKVPAGLRDGETLRLSRADGSVLLRIAFAPHPLFTVQGDDLHCEVPIDLLSLIEGGDIEVPTLDGRLRISPPDAPFGKEIRLKRKGLPQRKGRTVGDLVLHFRPVIPRRLSEAERTQLRALRQSLADNAATRMPEIADWQRRMNGRP